MFKSRRFTNNHVKYCREYRTNNWFAWKIKSWHIRHKYPQSFFTWSLSQFWSSRVPRSSSLRLCLLYVTMKPATGADARPALYRLISALMSTSLKQMRSRHTESFFILLFFLLLAFKALHFWYTWNTVQPWKLNKKNLFYNENDLSTYRGKITALTVLCTYLFKCFTVMIKAKPHNINKTNNTKTPWTAITL